MMVSENTTATRWLESASTILIVDDDDVNREFFEVMLKRLNFNVLCAVDGEEALEKVRGGNISLILLDNLLPKYSGWEVTRIIRTEPEYTVYKNTPIIMFSAMNTSEGKIKGYDLGIDDYITKPFNFVEVLARIKAVLRHRDVISQLIQREKQISIADTLSKSIVYFSSHIKKPIDKLMVMAVAAQSEPGNDPVADLQNFADAVNQDASKILQALKKLETELEYLEKQREELKTGEISIDILDKKYRDVIEPDV